MIRIGDYVRYKRQFKNECWYSSESYKVIRTERLAGSGTIYTLGRKYPPQVQGFKNDRRYRRVNENIIELDVKIIRQKKLKQIFND